MYVWPVSFSGSLSVCVCVCVCLPLHGRSNIWGDEMDFSCASIIGSKSPVFHLKLHPGETEFSGAQTQLPMYQEGESGRQILWMHYSWLWAGFGLPWWLNGKESACIAGDLGSIPGSERSPGKRNGTHSGILAWRIPGTEKPGRLQSMGLQRVGHDWATNTNTA